MIVIRIVNIGFNVLIWIVLLGVILSYIPRGQNNSGFEGFMKISDKITNPFQKLLDRLNIDTGRWDITPILAILSIYVLRYIVIRALLIGR